MEVFIRLLFGHFLADFTFQTNFIAEWKRRSFMGLLVHVLLHPISYIVLCWPFLNQTWFSIGGMNFNGWVGISIAGFLHFVEDWFRVKQINQGWEDSTVFYIWDQAVHLAVLWFISPHSTQAVQNTWPYVGLLFVIVTHFSTVTIWFIEKDIFGRDYPETEEKYISILYRLIVWLCFFLPHPWWIFVLIFVVTMFCRHVVTRQVDFSSTSVTLGNSIAFLCGFICRFGLNVHF
ncbi:MAG: DUF3307 domain-containing protein [Elusimicrobiota bacterium]